MENRVLLVAKDIDKRFGITHAVNNVSLTINAGEIRALIGENGSGKSTFSQMLCGIYTIGGGTFTLDGKPIHPRNQVEANDEGIAIIVGEFIISIIFNGFVALGAPTTIQNVVTGGALLAIVSLTARGGKGSVVK